MALKFATQTISLADAQGLRYNVVELQPWDADDPVVVANPSFFTDEPTWVRRSTPGRLPATVESASRAPGEFRGVVVKRNS